MRSVLPALALLVVMVAARDARACDRAQSPFENPEVGAAVADVVVVGEVVTAQDNRATVKVVKALKGSPGDDVSIRGVTLASDMDRCGGVPIEVGKRYVFLLWSPVGELALHHLVDAHGGVADAKLEPSYRDAIAKGHPHSSWRVKGDVATMLVRSPKPADPADVDLFVVLRNIGTKPKLYRQQAWPRQTQTKCLLAITNGTKRVAPRPVPIAQKDISSYFSKNVRKWETTIAAGDAWLVHLFRVTTAKQGWGYKEELGFVYYPIADAGTYDVSAECLNVFGVGTRAVTSTVSLTL